MLPMFTAFDRNAALQLLIAHTLTHTHAQSYCTLYSCKNFCM